MAASTVAGADARSPEDVLLPPSSRGTSCAKTLLLACQDVGLRPEVLHIVGASEAELSLNFNLLAQYLPVGARVVIIGPHAGACGSSPEEKLIGPFDRAGLQVSIFPQTYQRYMALHPRDEAAQMVVLFHPGLDIHYFSWYSCLKSWLDSRIPLIVTAYKRPPGFGETPSIVKLLLETLVGSGGGEAGMWVSEEENPESIEDGSFNAGYFLVLGSQGILSASPDDMYFSLFQALRKERYPFAPRVGYLDLDANDGRVAANNPRLLAAIAEGALRAAKAGEDGCDDATAVGFARTVLDHILGPGSGDTWEKARIQRDCCENCGEGFDNAEWHRSICPAVGPSDLSSGDSVRLANLTAEAFNGREGVLVRFHREKQRWIVRMGEKEGLFKAVNLQRC